ncbi:flagellar basal body P-ring formation chaperone FlgA [Bordetella genomosp. 1]|uniref:Flagella basal body P-ring formation protein FlgA n=1 Tax=Bordetella genomosp. 1 TaxID=1395607 RepID=A0ABX4F202_9BORD|nr:flagellar basal body P-ring formation chaperone FlgA [Bordetella genomosp. 1]MDQ8032382.1 flagellar basal body P-ring formation chaperone FlgA [Bordetella sp.]OZI66027.1 flagella basal body P-ring formation protein FlgA [Bordetella genomosp. 1]
MNTALPSDPRPAPARRAALALAAWLLACSLPAAANPGAAASQDPDAVAQVAQGFLLGQLADLGGAPSITLDPVKTDRLSACDNLVPFLPTAMRLRARMTVGVRCNTPQAWTTYVQATVSVPGEYYVAARQIGAGAAIQPDDLTTREADLVSLPAGAITDINAIMGMQATRRIAAGQAIRGNALRSAASVSRGQIVRITARGNGFVVSSEGQALDDAAPGAMVQVRTANGQVVSGVVRSAGLVEIRL